MQAIKKADTGSKCVNSNVKATTTNVTKHTFGYMQTQRYSLALFYGENKGHPVHCAKSPK